MRASRHTVERPVCVPLSIEKWIGNLTHSRNYARMITHTRKTKYACIQVERSIVMALDGAGNTPISLARTHLGPPVAFPLEYLLSTFTQEEVLYMCI